MRARSVRARTTLAATLVVAVALVAAGAVVVLSLWTNLRGQADTAAERTARTVAAHLAAGTPYDKLDLDDDVPVLVETATGATVARSEELGYVSSKFAATDDDVDIGETGDVSYSTGVATLGDDGTADYRFASLTVGTPAQGPLTVHAGAPLATEQSAVRTALTVLLVVLPLLLALVAGVTWLVTRRALRPVEGIRRELAAITASQDLARRVPEPAARDEVARLARTTNETLAALQASVDRQRRFVADASHELRSPIASLRTQLEVAAAHPELLDLDGAVEDTVRLQHLAADLLLLARLDAGETPPHTPVDLAALATETTAPRKGTRLKTEPGVEVTGSRSQLSRVLANLLDNAARHTRTEVSVTVRRDGTDAVLTVADDGPGVPPGDRERVFERFVRLDDARSRDDGGAGLGLAIARDIAVRHGGSLEVGEAATGGALFELRLPVRDLADGS
ncbi:HAMP domain-containing sensor histidine kinase [Streptomyces sp. NPDC004539]|uniref:sensor histidine kinase n=1 Tax=Streptomyces sp. NPDC004539 TaxID=3154280 RepID=UPI0033AC3004